MITEIFIENNKVDISSDLDSLITFTIDDVKNFSQRSTTFSKTVVLPGTSRNNALFGNIFETGISNDYDPTLSNIGINFNAAKSARCLIFQDNLQTFKGTVRLLTIINDRHRLEYEVALNGELTGLNVALSAGLLTDLDFSAYDGAYDAGSIAATWSHAPGSGVYYPLIDYGNYSVDKHDWDIRTFRPALYVKEYIDKMFAAANFRYQSDLFETDRFKRLIVPHNKRGLTTVSFLQLNMVAAYGFMSPQTVLYSGTGTAGKFQFTIFDGGNFTPDGSPATRATFVPAGPVSVNLVWNLSIQVTSDFATTFSIKKNGTNVFSQVIASTGMSPSNMSLVETTGIPITLVAGDYLEVWMEGTFGHNYTITFSGGQFSVLNPSPVSVPIVVGSTITINDSIPENIRQVDFLVSIVKLFNLYVYEDKFDERLIYIKPFVDFYDAGIVDWTYKLNRDAPIRIQPMSELNSKLYNFNYKDDSDYYNDLYKKRYNQGYGSYIYDSQFEFASQTNKLELIFASTPLVGYEGEEKVYPTIFKRTGNTAPYTEENIDSVIRILQTKKVMSVANWRILDGTSPLGSYTFYGYAGHFDDPDNPSNDLNFGAVKELFFVLVGGDLSKTQFNVYWSAYMAEITDKDSRMLIARFYLTAKDIFDLNFANYVVVDNVMFRLNKITDYNVTIPSDCEVQLLRAINTNYIFPPISPPDSGSNLLLWADSQAFLYDTEKILNS